MDGPTRISGANPVHQFPPWFTHDNSRISGYNLSSPGIQYLLRRLNGEETAATEAVVPRV